MTFFMDIGNIFYLTYLSSYKTISIFIFLFPWYNAYEKTEIPWPCCWRRLLAWESVIPCCSRFQVFLHHLLNIAIVQVLGCSGGVRALMVSFSPRPLTFNIFVGKMRLPAFLISFDASFKGGWKGIMTINFYLSGSLVLCGFKPYPPDPPDPVDF